MAELMKGHKWGEYKHKIKYPVIVEPKVDEIRLHVKRVIGGVQFLSYAGKPLHNLEGFAERFLEFMREYDLYELDMGFECNSNFNDSYRWVRSSKGIPADLENAVCKFMLYDIPDEGFFAFNEPYRERTERLRTMVEAMCQYGIHAFTLWGVWASSEDGVLRAYERYIREGKEGAMVKDPEHLYQRGKRSKSWLKMKPEEEADAKIVGFIEAKASVDSPGYSVGDPLGRTGSLMVLLEDGSTATPAGIEHALGFDIHQNPEKYLNQWIVFKYMERDRAGGYRHPSFVRFREDKQ